jgi:hypothetical protein
MLRAFVAFDPFKDRIVPLSQKGLNEIPILGGAVQLVSYTRNSSSSEIRKLIQCNFDCYHRFYSEFAEHVSWDCLSQIAEEIEKINSYFVEFVLVEGYVGVSVSTENILNKTYITRIRCGGGEFKQRYKIMFTNKHAKGFVAGHDFPFDEV